MPKINYRSVYFCLGILDLIAFVNYGRFSLMFDNTAFFFITLLHTIASVLLLASGVFYILGHHKKGNLCYFASLPLKVAFIIPTLSFVGPLVRVLGISHQVKLVLYAVVELVRTVWSFKNYSK